MNLYSLIQKAELVHPLALQAFFFVADAGEELDIQDFDFSIQKAPNSTDCSYGLIYSYIQEGILYKDIINLPEKLHAILLCMFEESPSKHRLFSVVKKLESLSLDDPDAIRFRKSLLKVLSRLYPKKLGEGYA